MAEQICPACGCTIGDSGYESGGVAYCYEPCSRGEPCDRGELCASSSHCGCGFHAHAEGPIEG